MNFLQVSYGNQILRRMHFVETVFKYYMNENDTYTIIADQNHVKDSRVNWIPAEDYEQEIIKQSDVIKEWWSTNKHDGKVKFADRADIIRVYYGSKNPNTLYFDTDISFNEPREDKIKSSKDRFEASNVRQLETISQQNNMPCYGNIGGALDDGLYFNGNNTWFYDVWFKWMQNQGRHRKNQPFGWYYKFITQSVHIVGKRPMRASGFYRHHRGT